VNVLMSGERLSKRYGGVHAVREVDIEILEGELVGLIGPNGAGKTTLFNLLSGFTAPTAGVVRWLGQDVTRWPPAARSQAGMVRTFQQARVFRSLTVRDNLRIACHNVGRSGLLSDLLMGRRSRSAAAAIDRRVDDLIDRFALAPIADLRAQTLSYGQAKRLGVIMGSASSPRLLMLDEPAAGLNNVEVAHLRHDLEQLRGQGVTVLLVEHHMGLVMGVSDRIVVLDSGEKIAMGTPEEVANDDRVIAAYLGVAP
jgi:branched-chain amino acid transport system ATP-binding protein